jgi:K+-transporting ATPase ATPase A chain
MTENSILQLSLYLICIFILVKPLGWYIACVYAGKPCGLNKILSPVERLIYRCSNVHPEREMTWKSYLSAMLLINLLGLLAVYLLQRLQVYLPLNPNGFSNITPDLAFNNAVSFTTNTNWQAYVGEKTMSYFTQMTAFTVQNFLSAATGLALLVAFVRGLARQENNLLGNFWVDLVRGILYILLPLAMLFAILLASQGVIQNFKSYQPISAVQSTTEQLLPMGPVASQVAIKQLGTNGGGFFNANSAHPYENPTPASNFLEMLAILLIPAALCYTFGLMIGDKRQGWALLFAMALVFIPAVIGVLLVEQAGNPSFTALGIDQIPQYQLFPGGNMEGKETRFGIIDSSIWTAATTATGNGSTNAMLDSFTPLGGFIALWLMHLGEVIFGGIGSGLYGMLMAVIMTVFVTGLMVGRTPEYLGKKIETFEIKMATFAILLMPLAVLIFTAVGVVTKAGTEALGNPGTHGFIEILYAFTSMGNNNGSAFAGLNANTPFYNILGGIEMLCLRYWAMISILAIAGSLARKKIIPSTTGTLPTHTLLFIILLIAVITILSALSFLPALALGSIAEHLTLWGQYGH